MNPTPQTALMPSPPASSSLALMPAMSLDDAGERYGAVIKFVKRQMVEGKDYGTIPGTQKASLLRPGAEKLITFFGLSVKQFVVDKIENWDDENPFFNYTYRTELWHGDILVATCDGSCNSKENRYRWRWVDSNDVPEDIKKKELKQRVSSKGHFRWQIDGGETTGQYGKPQEYWDEFNKAIETGSAKIYDKKQHWGEQKLAPYVEIESVSYRIPNDDVFTLVNTFQKMAQKRSMVGAVMIAANASEFFTQDMEDISDEGVIEEAEFVEVAVGEYEEKKPAKKPAEARPHAPTSDKVDFNKVEMKDLETMYKQAIDAGQKMTANEYWSIGRRWSYTEEYLAEVLDGHTNDAAVSNWREACDELVYGED